MEKRVNEVINRLNKTKVTEENVNFESARHERDSEENRKLVYLEKIISLFFFNF